MNFIGTKLVTGIPMTRLAYNQYRGWTLPEDENGTDEGYLVEYQDGGNSNHPEHKGYISWSPKEIFEGSYRATVGLPFGLAIEALKKGLQLHRTGWNGAGLWVEYIAARGVDLPYLRMSYPVGSKAYPDGARVSWVPSQTDMLAEDWQVREI